MTLQEFEEWFKNYTFVVETTKARPNSAETLIDVIKRYDVNGYFNSSNSLRYVIRDHINLVEPKEDQAFLILKYSDYLK